MKDFSHPGSDTKQGANLNRAIESTVEVCRNRWKFVAEVELQLASDLPEVPCFLGEFNQVILNLVVNAADAIGDRLEREGGTKGLIQITSKVIDDRVEIRVSDDGGGMPESVARRVFEPFFTTKPIGKGTGQGLPLSRNIIVNKHSGELDFETRPGQGTTFIIRLPITDPAAEIFEQLGKAA